MSCLEASSRCGLEWSLVQASSPGAQWSQVVFSVSPMLLHTRRPGLVTVSYIRECRALLPGMSGILTLHPSLSSTEITSTLLIFPSVLSSLTPPATTSSGSSQLSSTLHRPPILHLASARPENYYVTFVTNMNFSEYLESESIQHHTELCTVCQG